MKQEYVLCFKGKTINGDDEIYPLYEAKLKYIDMFTAYHIKRYKCNSDNELFKGLPEYAQRFIYKKFDAYANTYGYRNIPKGSFFIRKKCKEIRLGKTDLPVLFDIDADVLYANRKDIYEALCSLRIPLTDFSKEDEITKLKKEFFSKLFDMLSLHGNDVLASRIDEIIEQIPEYIPTRYKGVTTQPRVLRTIADYLCDNYLSKRSVLLLLKEYKKKLENVDNIRPVLVRGEELEKRMRERPFKFEKESDSFRKMYNLELEYFNEKYPKNDEEKLDSNKDKESIVKNVNKTIYDEDELTEYLEEYERKSRKAQEEEKKCIDDDFLGPKEPNDPRYREIN